MMHFADKYDVIIRKDHSSIQSLRCVKSLEYPQQGQALTLCVGRNLLQSNPDFVENSSNLERSFLTGGQIGVNTSILIM